MRKVKINDVLAFGLIVGGFILELGIIKKLDDIHEEIKYFEQRRGVYMCKKERDAMYKKENEEFRRKLEED